MTDARGCATLHCAGRPIKVHPGAPRSGGLDVAGSGKDWLALVSHEEVGRIAAVGEFVAERWQVAESNPASEHLGALLLAEGVDLLGAGSAELGRGTPVYVDAKADVVVVQRLMARHHIRRVAVVEDGCLVGYVDLIELAEQL